MNLGGLCFRFRQPSGGRRGDLEGTDRAYPLLRSGAKQGLAMNIELTVDSSYLRSATTVPSRS